MNLQTIIRAISSTKTTYLISVLICSLLALETVHGWEIDLSRRRKEVQKKIDENESKKENADTNFFSGLLGQSTPAQEIVILNTEKGFIPQSIRVRVGAKYTIHVVNVNEKEKNLSFISDAFSQYLATYYGKVKSFDIEPKKDGVFAFQCPETSLEGRIVVLPEAQKNRTVSGE